MKELLNTGLDTVSIVSHPCTGNIIACKKGVSTELLLKVDMGYTWAALEDCLISCKARFSEPRNAIIAALDEGYRVLYFDSYVEMFKFLINNKQQTT
jgi:hypothetical protein